MAERKPIIGVLALQGDFDAHKRTLEKLGVDVVLVRKPEQLDSIDGLIIPGGESSTFLRLLGEAGFEKLRDFVLLASENGDPVLVRQGKVMAATFHPELSEDTAVHKRFVELVEQTQGLKR
jgi:glutamine amidotransferase PdxT